MLKKQIKIFSVVAVMMLALIMLSSNVFATDTNDGLSDRVPANAERHDVQVEIPYDEEEDYIILSEPTRMWDQKVLTYSDSNMHTIATFASTLDNLAFETSAVVVSGTATGTYYTALCDDSTPIRILNKDPNGVISKVDWIPIDDHSTYTFRVQNGTGATIRITLTYYTW